MDDRGADTDPDYRHATPESGNHGWKAAGSISPDGSLQLNPEPGQAVFARVAGGRIVRLQGGTGLRWAVARA